MPRLDIEQMEKKARWIWEETMLLHKRCYETRVASSLSCVEILTALFYGDILTHNPISPLSEQRDRFVISKGHGSISFFPILADLGFVEMDELKKISENEGVFKAIPDTLIPGYETINGSVGHGIGVGCGIALALKRKNAPQTVFVLTGDGELFEGSAWEAIMFAGHHGLDNLVLIVDQNGASMLDFCENTIDLAPLDEKFRSFRWDAVKVDGHNLASLVTEFATAKEKRQGKPKVVVAKTVKGKGVPELEKDALSHIRVLAPEVVDRILEERK